jgi:hypothetical protein
MYTNKILLLMNVPDRFRSFYVRFRSLVTFLRHSTGIE